MAENSKPEPKIDQKKAESEQNKKDEELCKIISDFLKENGRRRVLLAGKAGIGKTRLAKKAAEYVTKNKFCFQTLCLHLNRKFEDERSLYENIASQLSVYSDFEETEVDDRDEDEEDEKKPEDLLDELKKDIIREISRKFPKREVEPDDKKANERKGKKQQDEEENKGTSTTSKQYLLLILDDDGNKTSEDVVMNDLKLEKFLIDMLPVDKDLKIIVTRRKGDEEDTKSVQESEEQEGKKSVQGSEKQVGEIESVEETKSEDKNIERPTEGKALDTGVAESVPSTGLESEVKVVPEDLREKHDNLKILFASLGQGDFATKNFSISDIVEKSNNSPAAIFVLAKSLTCIMRSTSYAEKSGELDRKIRSKTDEILSAYRTKRSKTDEILSADRTDEILSADRTDEILSADPSSNPILYLAYELLKINDLSNDAILDCFWHSLDFFEHCGCVYYRDLITQWILEGYFDPVRSVEKAYQDGHSILMELINRGMLKIQENNVVVPEMAMSNLIDPRRRGHLGRSRLGFSRVYRGDKKKGIGKITPIDDMIKTVQAKKGDKITTILVSGDRLRRETPNKYFAKLGDLKVLGLFEPTVDPFIKSFSDRLKLLRVLVIRDCDLLENIEELKTLKKLNALEVSGASSLTEIRDDFFKAFLDLQSLHLSGLQITSSPSSISELKELHCLIIKDCPLLEDLPDIQELKKLEVVDISGARGLQTCFDNTKGDKKNKSKNKNFYHLEKLQLLDFSESQIERLPIFQDSAVPTKLHSLTRLLLRNCSKLRRLPSLKPLSGLQILDLSGTTRLVEMLEVCFEDKKELKTLNLSGTNLSELATTIEKLSGLKKLLLKNCTNLEVLPNIEKLTNLEVFDASGSTKLHTIGTELHKTDGSFKKMSYLHYVNLSGTKVKEPVFPNESNIHCLKRVILADGKSFEAEKWSQIRRMMSARKNDKTDTQEECTKKNDVCKERLLPVPAKGAIYNNTISLFDLVSQQDVLEINETNNLDGKALATAEVVSFVDCSPIKLTSILKDTKLVKGCWLSMCADIKDLFSGMDEERLGSLEILSITNLPFLETISCAGSFKGLKKLNIDCCPKIETIFPEVSQMPNSLEVLHIKYCEKLEKVFEEGEVPTLTSLCLFELPMLSNVAAKLPNLEKFEKKSCPKLSAEKKDLRGSDWVMVHHTEAQPQD